ncbi:hypothetical protein FRC08_017307 [Ceratobasidium sp. 394]|nr:hypothetical protein FRC08_017307 [Ceratobasidium sp. 394]
MAVKAELHRWKSVDIAYSCVTDILDAVQFLSHPSDTVMLDSLTIGPMGQAALVVDDPFSPKTDPDTARSAFQKMNVRPAALRVDTYPIAFSPTVFSPHLTVLEVFTAGQYRDPPNLTEWKEILSCTPQLVFLRLWSARHLTFYYVNPPTLPLLHLPALRHLELSGAFVAL